MDSMTCLFSVNKIIFVIYDSVNGNLFLFLRTIINSQNSTSQKSQNLIQVSCEKEENLKTTTGANILSSFFHALNWFAQIKCFRALETVVIDSVIEFESSVSDNLNVIHIKSENSIIFYISLYMHVDISISFEYNTSEIVYEKAFCRPLCVAIQFYSQKCTVTLEWTISKWIVPITKLILHSNPSNSWVQKKNLFNWINIWTFWYFVSYFNWKILRRKQTFRSDWIETIITIKHLENVNHWKFDLIISFSGIFSTLWWNVDEVSMENIRE